MTRIEGIYWFRKPWEYGARMGRGSLGALRIGPDTRVTLSQAQKFLPLAIVAAIILAWLFFRC